MAVAHDLELESVNLNMDRVGKEEQEEEQRMREDGADTAPRKARKVHRIVSKWMLPEKVRRNYLERANCLPPPLFIISISLAEVNVLVQGWGSLAPLRDCKETRGYWEWVGERAQ